jgi:hypothetical protein
MKIFKLKPPFFIDVDRIYSSHAAASPHCYGNTYHSRLPDVTDGHMCDVLRHDDDLLRLNGTTTDPEKYCSYCQTTVGTLRNPNCQANANHLLCSDCNLKQGYNPCGVCGAEASHYMEIVPYHGNFSNELNHHINNLQKN